MQGNVQWLGVGIFCCSYTVLDGNNIWYGIYIKHNWHILEKIIFGESTKMLTEIFNISSWIAKIKFLISFQNYQKLTNMAYTNIKYSTAIHFWSHKTNYLLIIYYAFKSLWLINNQILLRKKLIIRCFAAHATKCS